MTKTTHQASGNDERRCEVTVRVLLNTIAVMKAGRRVEHLAARFIQE